MLTNSHQWLDAVMKRLFEPETRRIDKLVEQLTDKNSSIKGGTFLGFMHLGEIYVPEVHKPMYRAIRGANKAKIAPPLAFALLNDISAFQADVNKLKLDQAQIKQLLFKLISNSNNLQDIRNSLPECLAVLMPEFKNVERTLEDPCYYIRSDARSVKDYHRMLPKIEFYAMTRLIY